MTAIDDPPTQWEPDHELERQARAELAVGAPTNRRTAGDRARAGRTPPPSDPAAEQAVLAAMLLNLGACDQALQTGLDSDHFYSPANRAIYEAICAVVIAGAVPDEVTVGAELAGRLDQVGGPTWFLDLPNATGRNAATYARRVIATHRARTVLAGALEAAEAARAEDLPAALSRLELLVAQLPSADTITHRTLGDFLAVDEPDHDWVIPDILERTDRVLLTGPEGGGKSTLLRQIAVQTAAGIHPFTHCEMDPLTVLLLDLENSERHTRRQLRPLHLSAGNDADDRLHVAVYPQGLDLTDPADVGTLTHLITSTQPDLVVGGPVYKLVGGDPTEEQPAKAAAMTLDRLRTAHGFALMLETHQPHDNGGKRPERPYGASLWKRWPEFGLHLAETGQLRHWRGARDERSWPGALSRGGPWPWCPEVNSKILTYARIVELVKEHGRRLSERELSNLTGAPKTNIHNAITANQAKFDALCDQVEM